MHGLHTVILSLVALGCEPTTGQSASRAMHSKRNYLRKTRTGIAQVALEALDL